MNSGAQQLTLQFNRLVELLPDLQFPLPIDGAAEHRRTATALGAQLRDYLLPRSMRLDAPLLVVVGGSTGAGKSTLVNSLLGAQVTRPGVLRPTTKSPVLVCHPDDVEWFRSGNVVPALTRSDEPVHDSRALQLTPLASLPAGLALLDAPDFDSVDDENRRLSRQLLQAADLWLFVTSAARYADAVGWEILEQAAARNTVLSLVLNRAPAESMADLKAHLNEMLIDRGLYAAELFAVPEFELEDDGLLPTDAVQPIRTWLAGLVAEGQNRADVAVQSLAGATRALDLPLSRLAEGVRAQTRAVESLREQAEGAFQREAVEIRQATSDGTMLRGEVLSRWQDFVGTGDFMRSVEKQISAVRDRLVGWFRGGATKVDEVQVAINDGLAAVIVEGGQRAHESITEAWSITPWGAGIVDMNPELGRPTDDFEDEASRMIRQWQAHVLELVGEQGKSKRFRARLLAMGTNAVGVALIIVVFASTGGLTTAEVGIAGGASLLAQRLLEGVFGEDAVRRLTMQAKRDLDERVDALLATQLARFEEVLDSLEVAPLAEPLEDLMQGLREATTQVFADLTRPEGY